MVVDTLGMVLEASTDTPGTLFGLAPSALVGRSVSSFVDIFQQGSQDDDLGMNEDALDLLASLVTHTKEHPGAAFNVGVLADRTATSRLPKQIQDLMASTQR